jgi:hypothetical protein
MRRLVMAPVSTAASGNTSWMLNTSGPRRTRCVPQPVRPMVSGGDMAMTASTRPPRNDVNPASALNPAKPAARRSEVALVVARERVHTGDRTPWPWLAPNGAPLPPGSIRCSRYQGSAVTTCSSCPSAASSCDDAGDHLTGGRGVGGEVRAQHGDAQGAVSVDGGLMQLQGSRVDRRERGPAGLRGEVLARSVAGSDELVAPAATSSSTVAHAWGAAVAPARRRRRSAACTSRRCTPPGTRGSSPRSAAHRTLRTRWGTPSRRPSPAARCGRRRHPAQPRSTRAVGAAAQRSRPPALAAGEHQPQSGSVQWSRIISQQEVVPLVRVRDRRVDDDRAVAQSIPSRRFVGRRHLGGERRLDAVRHHHHPVGRHAVRAHHRVAHVLAGHGHHRGPPHRRPGRPPR